MSEKKHDDKTIKAFLAALCKRHPKAFAIKKRIALKVNIDEDILAIYKAMNPELLDSALKYYTSHPSYKLALCLQSYRRDLNGEKVQKIDRYSKVGALYLLKLFKKRGFYKGPIPKLKDENEKH